MEKLLYPNYKISIGNYILSKGIKFDVYSAKDSYYDWAKLTVLDQLLEVLTLNKNDSVNIKIGYDEKFWDVFSGSIEKDLKKDFVCKDNMLKLKEIKLTETFLNTDPIEIIKFGVARAGISNVQMKQVTFAKRPRFLVANKSILEMITQAHKTWDIDEKFFFTPEGAFCWGVNPSSDKTYSFVYGENVISLELKNKTWYLNTVAAPFIRHSCKIDVQHPKIKGTFEVISVHHYTTEEGYLRTELSFEEVA